MSAGDYAGTSPTAKSSGGAAASAAGGGTDLSAVDVSSLRDLDPSVRDGFKIIYDRECPFEMRVQEGNDGPGDVGTLEAVRVRVLTAGEGSDLSAVRVELVSEADLFFSYLHTVRPSEYGAIQDEQRLMVSFADYPGVLCRSLNAVITHPHTHLGVFVMHRDGHARLDFIENMEFKFVELLSVNFMRSPDDVIREQVSYRYNAVKAQKALLAARLQDVQRLIQAKNPSLLLQLQKAAAGATARRS